VTGAVLRRHEASNFRRYGNGRRRLAQIAAQTTDADVRGAAMQALLALDALDARLSCVAEAAHQLVTTTTGRVAVAKVALLLLVSAVVWHGDAVEQWPGSGPVLVLALLLRWGLVCSLLLRGCSWLVRYTQRRARMRKMRASARGDESYRQAASVRLELEELEWRRTAAVEELPVLSVARLSWELFSSRALGERNLAPRHLVWPRGGDDAVCAVCQAGYSPGQRAAWMPCNHVFHE
jgi:hypothetical protein